MYIQQFYILSATAYSRPWVANKSGSSYFWHHTCYL